MSTFRTALTHGDAAPQPGVVPALSSHLGAMLFDDRYLQDPYPLYALMHADAPVHPVGDSGVFAVCTWDAVSEAVARTEDFSSNLTATMTCPRGGKVGVFTLDDVGGPTQVLATADDPAHAAHRKMVVPQLAAKRIRALEAFVAETMAALWRNRADRTVEWMDLVANRLPMMVVCRLIGVPDEDSDRLGAWAYASTQLLEGLLDEDALTSAGAAAIELAGYIADQLRQSVADPRDNLLGDLATACATGELEEVTAQVMMLTLFGAGGESTAALIGSAAWVLATRPDLQQRLRAEPDLIPAFLEETLRFEPPFRGHYRHVLRDSELAGHDLSAGSRLILLWGAANRDPSRFSEPDQFRLSRANSQGHIAFGRGAHFCVGAALARLEARIVLEHLLRQTSWIELAEPARWLPSLLVRRLRTCC